MSAEWSQGYNFVFVCKSFLFVHSPSVKQPSSPPPLAPFWPVCQTGTWSLCSDTVKELSKGLCLRTPGVTSLEWLSLKKLFFYKSVTLVPWICWCAWTPNIKKLTSKFNQGIAVSLAGPVWFHVPCQFLWCFQTIFWEGLLCGCFPVRADVLLSYMALLNLMNQATPGSTLVFLRKCVSTVKIRKCAIL